MRLCHTNGFPIVRSIGAYTYPDVVVACGEPELADHHQDVLLNPDLIAEALSPSTEANDRGRKFCHYRTIPSLKAYLMLATDCPQVELYTRRDHGRWALSEASLRSILRNVTGVCFTMCDFFR